MQNLLNTKIRTRCTCGRSLSPIKKKPVEFSAKRTCQSCGRVWIVAIEYKPGQRHSVHMKEQS